MTHYALRIGRAVAEMSIQNEIRDAAQACTPDAGIPSRIVATVRRTDPHDPSNRTVVVDVDVTWT